MNIWLVIDADGNIIEAFDNETYARVYADGYKRADMDGCSVQQVPPLYNI